MSFETLTVILVLIILVLPVLFTLFVILQPLLRILRLQLAALYFIFLVCACSLSEWFAERQTQFLISLFVLIGVSLLYSLIRFFIKRANDKKESKRMEQRLALLIQTGVVKAGDTITYDMLDF